MGKILKKKKDMLSKILLVGTVAAQIDYSGTGDVDWLDCYFSGVEPLDIDWSVWNDVVDTCTCVYASYDYFGQQDYDGSMSVDNCELAQGCWGMIQQMEGEHASWSSTDECWFMYKDTPTITPEDIQAWCADGYSGDASVC